MANVGAGVFQGMPVSTSLSASSLNESAGARTPVASLDHRRARARDAGRARAALLGAAEGRARRRDHRRGRVRDDRHPRAAPPLPRDAVRLLDRGRRDRRRALGGRARRRRDRRRALARLAHLRRDAGRRCRCSAASPARRCSATSTRTPTTRRSRASPCCASTAASSSPPPKRSRTASASSSRTASQLRALVLDLEGVNFVDSQGAAKLTEIHELTDADGVALRLARVKPQVLTVLEADGFVDADRRRPHPRQRPSRRRGAAGQRIEPGRLAVRTSCGRRGDACAGAGGRRTRGSRWPAPGTGRAPIPQARRRPFSRRAT